jgi:hypothetical protein
MLFAASIMSAQVTAPQLTAINRTSGATLTAGSPVTFNFAITPGTESIGWIDIFFQDSTGFVRDAVLQNQATGTATLDSTSSWVNGTYAVTQINIKDAQGRFTTYYRNGTISNSAPGVIGPTTHSISFAALDFAVNGGLGAVTAPQLAAINRTSGATLTAGSPVTFNFVITPGTDSIGWIDIFFQDSTGFVRDAVLQNQATGTATLGSTSSWANGTYAVTQINIKDAQGRFTAYYRNGTISNSAPGVIGPTTHSLSFSVLDFNLAGATNAAPSITTQPASQTVTMGQSANLSVTALGTTPLNFQWLKDGVIILGATSATLSLSNVQSIGAGNYTVIVSNVAGNVTSSTAALTVTPAVTISVQPSNQTASVGFLAQFGVTATPSLGTSYQWYKNGTAIPGATSFLYTITNTTSADAGSYSVVVSNGGFSVTSNSATLMVSGAGGLAPTIGTQPTDQSVQVGFLTFLSVTASGAQPLSYQWFRNGALIAGATTMFFTVSSTQPVDAGSYSVVVSNSFGSVTSNTVILRVGTEPTFSAQPSSRSATVGDSVNFSVVINGTAPFSYQWRKDGATIAGATSPTLVLANVQVAAVGSYSVVVTNSAGSVISNAAQLAVNLPAIPPSISAQPSSQGVLAGASISFSVNAAGTAPLSYQWRKDSTAISGATNATLTLSGVQSTDAGSYIVVVTNSADSVTSNVAILSVTGPNPGRLINLSVLTDIATAGDDFTLGYVVGGTGTSGAKPLVIRAAGPSLGAFGVPGTLDDPKFELFAGSTKTSENDNWGGSTSLSASLSAVGAFAYTGPASKDAATTASITTRDNSVRVSAVGSGTGKVIAEIYDATPAASFTTATPRLINVSVRKNLGSGLTMGFVVGGATPAKVLVRGIGPTLGAFGVPGTVVDPQLTLFNSSSAKIGENNDWAGTPELTAGFASVGAFALPATSKDAALLVTLAPGNYTAQVTGVNGTTGVALVEVYEVP